MGLGLQRRQRRLGRLPRRLHLGREGPDRQGDRHADRRPRAAGRALLQRRLLDPESTTLTYAWDFGDGATSTQANPSHTYAANGSYTAKLTVTDGAGLTAVANVPITVGNRPPVITIEFPKDGQVASFTDKVNYKISVTDPEDGTTASGISCNDVRVDVSLGHDEHAHTLSSTTGCTGTFNTGLTSGHGAEANTFTVLGVSYTDKGATGARPLTGRAQAILQPKTKQAEFFASTGRVADGGPTVTPASPRRRRPTPPAAARTSASSRTATTSPTSRTTSRTPRPCASAWRARARAARSRSASTRRPARSSAPRRRSPRRATGRRSRTSPLNLTSPPAGTHELFLVFRNKGSTQNLFNVNWFEVVGKGAATTASPEVSATATPLTGTAPLNVKFDATATDPEGKALTYAWDFGVPGITTDTSTAEDPSYTLHRGRDLRGLADGHRRRRRRHDQVAVREGRLGVRSAASATTSTAPTWTPSWSVIRRDQTLTVTDGAAEPGAQAGDVYQTANNAKNLVLRTAPSGPWTITTKLNFKGLVQYQQAGILVYGDDDNYTKFDRVATNAATAAAVEKFEFINEVAGTPRNGSADATANLAPTFPNDFYMR